MTTSCALVTGASSGLGEEYSLQLAARTRHHIILVARREDRLRALAERIVALRSSLLFPESDRSVSVLLADLSLKSERERLLAELESRALDVHVLINNAGFGSFGRFLESDPDWELNMVAVNCQAPLHLLRGILPGMVERRSGTIVNVASTASFQPVPYMATYGATKAFVRSLSTAVGAEIHGSGVNILAHCPGPTRTEFHLVVGLQEKLGFVPSMDAKVVVRQALDAAFSGRAVYVNGLLNKVLSLAGCLPSSTAARAVERVLRSSR